ncbi:MAG: hypothetical protein RLZZ387_2630 [Chloroflexota bacterium]|jgi:hypothetical protein
MGNISNTRFPFGLTNVGETNLFADMVQPDPTLFHEYWNDFDTYTAGDWVVTETDAGATQALTAGDGGLLLVTNTAANDDLVALQKTPAAFTFTAGKKTFFRARFKVSDATQSDVVIGLQVVDTTPLDVTDGVYFLKADGSTSFSFVCRKNATTGSTSVASVATLADDTYITLGFYYDGEGKVAYEVNGAVLGSLDASSAFLPDTTCTVSFALQNGEAVAKTMTVDYLYAAKER